MSLPNLHPAVVHFPIALWAAAIGFDLACLVLRRHRWIDYASGALYALGTAGAAAACLAGENAEDSLTDLPASLETLVEGHSDWGWRTLIFFSLVAAARLVLIWLNRNDARQRLTGARWLVLAGAVGGMGAVIVTADRGGALVYQHGVAVSAGVPAVPAPTVGKPQAAPAPPPSGIAAGADGSFAWTPPAEGAAGGDFLVPAEGSDPGVIQAEPQAAGASGGGLLLRVTGRGLRVLPGPRRYGDVQIEAVIDLAGFDGTVALAHHASGSDQVELFQVGTQGAVALVHRSRGAERKLDLATMPRSTSPLRLTVSSVGLHIKGMVNGKVLAHGHVRPLPDGSAGLLLDGTGTVRLLSFRVQPIIQPTAGKEREGGESAPR